MQKNHSKAFTLAELLIAIAILGIIATFTIPKILNTQQNGKKTAIFKETIATLNAVIYQGVMMDGITTESQAVTYLLEHINGVKICTNTALVDGCRTEPIFDTSSFPTNSKGILLHNGATINIWAGEDAPYPNIKTIVIDWNGDEGPNQLDDDELVVWAALSPDGPLCDGSNMKIGTVSLYNCNPWGASTTLFDALW